MPRKAKDETPQDVEEEPQVVEEQPEQPTGEAVTEQEENIVIEPPTPISVKLDDKHRKALRLLLDVMEEIGIEDATFHYADGAIGVREMDASHVAMVDATVYVGNYTIDGVGVKRNFTTNVQHLNKALSLDSPTLDVQLDRITISGRLADREAVAKLPLLQPLIEEVPTPKLTFDVDATLDFSEVYKAFAVLPDAPDTVSFDSNGNGLIVKGGSDQNTIQMNGYKATGVGRAMYPWAYVKALGKREWKIEYRTDMPLKATRTETGVSEEERLIADLAVWVAPRIESS